MKTVGTLIIILAIVALFFLAFIFLGFYDISASHKEGAWQRWMMSNAMVSSVRRNAKGIVAPQLGDSSQIATGFEHFREMCIGCHGAPGKQRSEIGEGLNPMAPDLPRTTVEWSNAELFWILKNGIKMTGMPAFGATHSDRQIWSMVSFVRLLEKMTPEKYKEWEDAHAEQ